MVTFLLPLNIFLFYAPILVGLIFVSTYMVFNFGLTLAITKKKPEIVSNSSMKMAYFIRSVAFIFAVPLIHTATAILISGLPLSALSPSVFAPDYYIFQIAITVYLAAMLFIGYHFPLGYINSFVFNRWGFFSLSIEPDKNPFLSFRDLIRGLSFIASFVILIGSVMIFFSYWI